MAYQNTVQNSNAIRFGSGKLEVGDDVGSLVNLGAMRGIKFSDEFDVVEIETDNCAPITVGVKNHVASVEGELVEINLTNLNNIRGGIDTLTNVAGTSTDITAETHTLSGTTGTRLDHANGDGTIVTAITVTDADDGAAVLNTDYVLYVDSEGYTCIARVDGSIVITDGDGVKVNYTYVPNAAIKLTSGGKVTISTKVVRITNTNESGKDFRITVYKATNQKGIELELQGDDDDDVSTVAISLKGVCDSTRDAGDQLFEIYDEQGVIA